MIENILTLLSYIYVQKYDYMNNNYFLFLTDHAFNLLKHNNLTSKPTKQNNNTNKYLIQLKCSKNEIELKQYSKLKAYLVFSRVFNFLG